ncbi:hypothetical protein KDW_62200 [Dictyobacter vulcani]|uniref:LTD domain-containing protein n=1 Tax=Dictyobacter vulcani TaxID=2607529 RepID=A0A5J4KQT3_9CHLR|nr:hypothetical protein [Dictyobacter vulcani]GER92058.1 hypothetical protein KDW_62200 [Dictyobacter vulcani]
MKRHASLCVLFCFTLILVACSSTPPVNGSNTPTVHISTTPTATLMPPKLEVTPNTGLVLDCSKINQKFELYNSGGRDLLWVSQVYSQSGITDKSLLKIKLSPTGGTLVSGGHLVVIAQGTISSSLEPVIISFIYKDSAIHAQGISQSIICK